MGPCYGLASFDGRSRRHAHGRCDELLVRPLVGPSVGPRRSTAARAVIATVTGMIRQCSRPGCASPALATLTYQYGQALVWIDVLAAERDPHSYDLCGRHAARVSVPNGWQLVDRRVRELEFGGRLLAG